MTSTRFVPGALPGRSRSRKPWALVRKGNVRFMSMLPGASPDVLGLRAKTCAPRTGIRLPVDAGNSRLNSYSAYQRNIASANPTETAVDTSTSSTRDARCRIMGGTRVPMRSDAGDDRHQLWMIVPHAPLATAVCDIHCFDLQTHSLEKYSCRS